MSPYRLIEEPAGEDPSAQSPPLSSLPLESHLKPLPELTPLPGGSLS